MTPTRNGTPLRALRGLCLGASLLALAACSGGGIGGLELGELDWDLRAGSGSTSDEARQATAQKPRPDANGILSYPGYQLAEARRGETVTTLATRLGLDPAALARTNALRPADPLRAGELLLLPARVSAAPQPVTPATGRPVDITAIATTALDNVPAAPAAAAASPGGGREPLRHVVARGETAFTIARSYNISAKALAEWNGLNADLAVREGQTLIIPVATAPAPALEPVPAAPGAGSATPVPPSAAKPLPDETTEPATVKPKETPASPDLGNDRTEASATRMAFPVQGKIIRGFDKKKNQGIDIAAPAGTAVTAADAGTVAAITRDTDQVPIVVIRHADNILTVYAGVDALTVKKGDKVARGAKLGVIRAGDPAFLHFEVRRGVDALDPIPYLQ